MTAVYDRQRWACIHEDEISDKLVQEKAFGLFANAYLAVASKGAGSFKAVFANTTAPEKKISRYALRSWKKMEKDMWKKTALTAAAEAHIRSMSEKYEKLTSVNPAVKVLEPHYSKDNKAVRFGFLKEKHWRRSWGADHWEKKAPVEALKAAMDRVFGQAVLKKEPFTPTDQFKEVFGDSEEILSLQDTSYEVSNIDGLLKT